MLVAKTTQKPRELPKDEMTQSVCAFIVDCGEHEETELATGKVALKPKVMFVFELEQKRSDGLPFILSQTFTNSLHPKSNLYKFLKSWEGRDFSEKEQKEGIALDPYIGKNLYITPVHNKGYANVGSVTKIREKDAPMPVSIKELPKWVHSFIAKAKVKPIGYRAPDAPPPSDDDVPF